jgi:hypothetical protein
MGFSIKMPANQVGIPKKSWDIWGYGLPEVWYKGGSTVVMNTPQAQSHSLEARAKHRLKGYPWKELLCCVINIEGSNDTAFAYPRF